MDTHIAPSVVDTLPTLYKRNSNGSVNQWTISVEPYGGLANIVTTYGQVGGAMQTTRDLVIVFSGDEETSGVTTQRLLAEHHALVDAEFAINADAGWIFKKGAIDFAGGTVVHINAGIAGLVGDGETARRVRASELPPELWDRVVWGVVKVGESVAAEATISGDAQPPCMLALQFPK